MLIAIRKGDQKLAQEELYFYVDAFRLMSPGCEYEWCLQVHGRSWVAALPNIKRSFDWDLDVQKRNVEMQERNRKQMEELDRQAGRTNTPHYVDYSMNLGSYATNRFVGSVGLLVEILAGSGHTNEAENIRDQALAVTDDSRIKSAVADAETRIQKQAASPKSSAVTYKNPATLRAQWRNHEATPKRRWKPGAPR